MTPAESAAGGGVGGKIGRWMADRRLNLLVEILINEIKFHHYSSSYLARAWFIGPVPVPGVLQEKFPYGPGDQASKVVCYYRLPPRGGLFETPVLPRRR